MLVEVFKAVMVKITKPGRSRILKFEKEGLCLACGEPLDGKRTVRKCHERCYRATVRAIRSGYFTEEQRVSEGKLGEVDNGPVRISNPVTIEARGT